MQTAPEPQSSEGRQIVAVDFLSVGVLVAFDDGKEFIYSAEALYALIPEEFELEREIERLISA